MRKLFALSLVANMALLAVAVYGIRQRTAIVTTTPAHVEQDGAPVASSPPENLPGEPTKTPTEPVIGLIQSWPDIESTDFKEYMENLRKVGCPEETIADIIISEVSEMFRVRLAQLPAIPKREFKYWQTGPSQLYPRLDPALEKARREIEAERDELLRVLLGPNYATFKIPRGASEKWMYDEFFAALPAGKRNQLFDINDRYEAAVRAIKDKRQHYMDEDDAKELNRLRLQRDGEMAGVLTPEELENFQIRLSEEAERVRGTVLSTFDASEQEFRAIVAAKLKGQEEADLERALGEERYKEYKLSENYEYRQLAQIVKKQKLEREVARDIFDMKAKVEREVSAIRADRSHSMQENMQRLSDLRARTLEQIAGTLGPEGFQQYFENAWWVRNLPSTNPTEFSPGGIDVRPAVVVPK